MMPWDCNQARVLQTALYCVSKPWLRIIMSVVCAPCSIALTIFRAMMNFFAIAVIHWTWPCCRGLILFVLFSLLFYPLLDLRELFSMYVSKVRLQAFMMQGISKKSEWKTLISDSGRLLVAFFVEIYPSWVVLASTDWATNFVRRKCFPHQRYSRYIRKEYFLLQSWLNNLASW